VVDAEHFGPVIGALGCIRECMADSTDAALLSQDAFVIVERDPVAMLELG